MQSARQHGFLVQQLVLREQVQRMERFIVPVVVTNILWFEALSRWKTDSSLFSASTYLTTRILDPVASFSLDSATQEG